MLDMAYARNLMVEHQLALRSIPELIREGAEETYPLGL